MRGLNYPFFRFLVDQGFVEVQTLETLLRRRSGVIDVCEGVYVLEELERECGVSQVEVMKRLSKWVGIEFRERLDEEVECDGEIVSVESHEVAQCEGRVKFRCGEGLWLLVVDPWSHWEGGYLGEECNVCITTTHEFRRWMDLLFESQSRDKNENEYVDEKFVVKELAEEECCEDKDKHEEVDGGDGEVVGEEIASYVEHYLAKAHGMCASDVHFEPINDGMRIRYRVDGVLRDEGDFLPARIMNVMINQLKLMGGMSVAEKRVPQEGAGVCKIRGTQCALRFACMPTIHGESVVVRCMVDVGELRQLTEVGLEVEDYNRALNVLECSQGLVLVVGPTGSGKSTTLYAMLQQLSRMGKKIVSIEDPIEVAMCGVSQVQVDECNGISFESVLKSFLRQAPDVIMIGEIRDRETAAIAVQASCTGHLVLGTLHTNDAINAIVRLIDLGVDVQLLASVLGLVIAQRLVRVGREGEFHGRSGVFEVLEVDDELRAAIRKRVAMRHLRLILEEGGFVNLWQGGLMKVREGITTMDELRRCMPQWILGKKEK